MDQNLHQCTCGVVMRSECKELFCPFCRDHIIDPRTDEKGKPVKQCVCMDRYKK